MAPQILTAQVIEIIRSIPPGKVSTYGRIAQLAGSPRAARQVARILHSCSEREGLPWHRVVNAAGHISRRGDGSSEREQRRRLRAEGVLLAPGGRVDLRTFGWDEG